MTHTRHRYTTSLITLTALSLLLLCVPLQHARAQTPSADTSSDKRVMTILSIGDKNRDYASGVRQGVQEGELQGRFLGFSIKLIEQETVPSDLSAVKADAIITALPERVVLNMLRSLPSDTPVINVLSRSDSLRDSCQPNLLHTVPSNSMLTDATVAWNKKKPDTSGSATAWHPDFKKFAARDLNKRYKAAHQKAMTPAAWAGWAASRSMADAYARGGLDSIKALTQADRGGFIFDGQKGHDMSLLPNGQLQQVLITEGADGQLLGEAPGLYPAAGLHKLSVI